MMEPPRRSIRWWPALVVLAGTLAGLAFVWIYREDRPMQTKFMRTVMLGAWTSIGLLGWLLFLSRAPRRTRIGIFSAVAVAGMLAGLSLEIRGVSGNMVPILAFRWTPKHRVAAAETASTNAWKHVAGEFPGFYGPERNATIRGTNLETNWAVSPPVVLWKIPVGQGWSGFAVKDGLAITQEQREGKECVVAYEVASGRVVWTHADEARYATTIAGEGPRATPGISGDRVYTFGATGLLNCLELATGKRVWMKDTVRENETKVPDWGLAGSPLIAHGQAIVSVGGSKGRSLVSYDAGTGDYRWGSGDAAGDYSSPVPADLAGSEQVLIFNGHGIVAHDLGGQKLWDYPWRGGHPHITPPLVVGTNTVLASSGYGTGAELLRVENAGGKWAVARVWKSMAIKSKFGPLFAAGGFVYGFDDGIFACADLATGARRWKDGRYGHGQGLLVGGLILLTSEKGEIVLIQPNPEGLVELGRLAVFSDKTWNPPALAGEYLLVRNHFEAACLRLPLKVPALVSRR